MPDDPPALACRLDALGRDEQVRRAALAEQVTARFAEVRETDDGYAARLTTDPALARDVMEWILLERRCCPFLRLEVEFMPASDTMWLGFGGGPGVKAFLAAAGLGARANPPGAPCGC
jgi:hypothetical protein